MASPTTIIQTPWHFAAGATGTNLSTADGSVTDAKVASGAAITTAKMLHRYRKVFSQPLSAATSETRTIYVATASGTVLDINCGSATIAVGAATVTVDLKKSTAGGAAASILTSVVTLDSGNATYTPEAGSISSNSYVAGDVFTITTVATAGGGTLPTAVYAQVTFDEYPV
jgi:hypothetical protein